MLYNEILSQTNKKMHTSKHKNGQSSLGDMPVISGIGKARAGDIEFEDSLGNTAGAASKIN